MADNSLKKGRYTKYGNKIGLFSNSKGSFIQNEADVVLNFPFKDSILEAGMSKEDVGREERFLHLEIDSKDIDTLEEPKVLTDFRYIDKDGETALDSNSDIEFFDAKGNLKHNLLIKGNNLLALYTLRERLAGQVKLIYIDPPYNTGNDGFRYNDSFNHSAWLAFMKNRLEVARELLTDDGVIFVSCDDNEQAYLKVLMDEIFQKANFVSTVTVATDARTRSYEALSKTHEFILIYSKTAEYELHQAVDDNKQFKHNDSEGGFDLYELRNRNASFNVENRPNLFYPFYLNPNNKDENGLYELSIEPRQGWVEVLPQKSGDIQTVWRQSKETAGSKLNTIIFGKEAKNGYQIVKKYRETTSSRSSIWNNKEVLSDRGTLEIKALFSNKKVFDFPKPEGLLETVISLGSNEGDIVLDFCLGSGTTSAAAHKMNRLWVGVEQMDYIEDVAKERLKQVVAGEQGGISTHVGWKGGGSFVYLELKKYNQEFIDRIQSANSKGELDEVYGDMAKNAFLKFWFDKNEFEKDENFRSLDLEKRKKLLIDILDENQLYLNYADMNDAKHNVSASEKTLTDKFYGSSKN